MATIKQNAPYTNSKTSPALGGFAKDTTYRSGTGNGGPTRKQSSSTPDKVIDGKCVAGMSKSGK
jgi:hypothetical protein